MSEQALRYAHDIEAAPGDPIPCVIESPFRGANRAEEMRNRAYLDKLIRHVTLMGYTPYASHKVLTDAFNDNDSRERQLGIDCGLVMATFILRSHPKSLVFFGLDYGETEGMVKYARPRYKSNFPDRIRDLLVGRL